MEHYKNYIEHCQSLYFLNFSKLFHAPRGANIKEITQVEENLHCIFPDSYKQFLLWMGNDTRGIFQGSEWFLQDVEDNTNDLSEFLEENSISIKHSGSPLCFFSHQGYMSAWFYLPSHDADPEVYFYSETFHEKIIKKYSNFSSFLLEELKGKIPLHNNQ